MNKIALKTNKTIDDYSGDIKELILDIREELMQGIKDGLGVNLASQKGDKASIYSFLKDQGYNMTYEEFVEFYEDSLKIIDDNGDAIVQIMEERACEELNDNDLEQVAGGSGWWQKNWKTVAFGVGAALLIGAITVATCGTGTLVMTSAASMGLSGAVASSTLSGFIAAGLSAAGIGAITSTTFK